MGSPCYVCGTDIRVTYNAVFEEDENWQKYQEHPGYLFMEAKELEEKLRYDALVSFHRLILYDSSKKEFILTGIGQKYDECPREVFLVADRFTAPKDTGKAFIGKPPKGRDDLTKVCYEPDVNWWAYQVNFKKRDCREWVLAMHMSCWKLAQCILGSSIEKNFELFAAITLQNDFIDAFKCPWGIGERLGLKEWFKGDYDPYRVPEVQTVIDSSRVVEKPTPFTQPLWDSRISNLPVEILFQVLDFLDCKEISKLRVAMRIDISDHYWCSRAALTLIEMDEIVGEDLNWQYLCSRIEASYQFISRRYMVDLLRNEIKPTYLRNLKKRDFPRLEEVIDERQDKVWVWSEDYGEIQNAHYY